MDEKDICIRVHRSLIPQVLELGPVIFSLYSVRFGNRTKRDTSDNNYVFLPMEVDISPGEQLARLVTDVQSYVDSMSPGVDCEPSPGGEDSSYDSDFETDERAHVHVNRTSSDKHASDFSVYFNTKHYDTNSKFALKLGYTEDQVQASVRKLGPYPGQNELLEELIKLGAMSPRVLDEEVNETSRETWPTSYLRPIVIDGSNVAMAHGNKTVFSCRGIKIAVEWFKSRGHKNITAFVPKWRKEAPRPDNPIVDQEILTELERERILVYTPSRLVGGRRTVCYDDRYVLRLAVEVDGIVVSNDNYRDLVCESLEFKKIVEERTLMYSFVNDRFMPPDDPLGRSGPTLENFLRCSPIKGEPPPPCPYGKKCTYGNKCKYHHPERGPQHKSVTDLLVENARRQAAPRQVRGKSLSVPLTAEQGAVRKTPLARSRSGLPNQSQQAADDKFGKSWSVENVRLMPVPQADSAVNLHRKLQRQLTLNPSCDPRLQGYVQVWGDPSAHHCVTRMASAPDPARPLASAALSSPRMASDPTLYRPPTTEEARRKLHYHLASIFPEEHVLAAMRSLPDETRPQEICAAILNMFPSG